MKKKNIQKYILILDFIIIYLCAIKLFAQANPVSEMEHYLENGQTAKAQELLDSSKDKDYYNKLQNLNYFYTGRYSEALAALKDEKYVFQRMVMKNHLEKLVEITKDFKEYDLGHFVLRLKQQDLVLKDILATSLEKIYSVIGSEFNFYPQDKVIIEFYPTKEEFAFASTLGDETLERSGAIGICKFNRIMLVSPVALPQGYRWIDSVCHEYVHFAVNRKTVGKCPLWLHEGTARYHDTLWRSNPPVYITPGNVNVLVDALNNDKMISFKRMSPSLVYLKDQDEVNLAFVEVSNSVEFMNKKYKGKLQKILENLKQQEENQSFKSAIGMDINKFESKWKEYLKKSGLKKTDGALADKINWHKVNEIDEFVGVNVRDYLRLGDRFKKGGNIMVALIQYEKALSMEPYNPVVLYRKSRVLISQNKIEEAMKAAVLCVENNPNYVSGFELAGELCLVKGENEKAAKYLREALEMNPYNQFTVENYQKAKAAIANKP